MFWARAELYIGGVGNTVISSYSGALFVVGGSGVTFALSAVQDLVRCGHSSDVADIDIVWSIADPGTVPPFLSPHGVLIVHWTASLTPMIPLFAAFISQSTAARVRVSVFYTRASGRSLEGMYLPPGMTLAPGRPNLGKHLDALVSATRTAGGCSGVFVGVCGPVTLAASASESVKRFDVARKRAVGGVEFHEECVDVRSRAPVAY